MSHYQLPPGSRKLRAAILGATGTVGQRFISLLANHPYFEIHALCASPRSAGRAYATATQWKLAGDPPAHIAAMVVESCAAVVRGSRLAECDVAFSGLDSGVATAVEAAVARAGIPVFSNAKNYRMHERVPLVVPTANGDHLAPMVHAQLAAGGALELLSAPEVPVGVAGDAVVEQRGGYIVANSNCSTTGLVVVMRAIEDALGPVARAHVVTLQAVSGAGYPGLPVLDVFDNVVPFIDGEEDKLETEPHKILGAVTGDGARVHHRTDLAVSASCNRVPVLDGHTLNVSFTFADSAARAHGTLSPEAVMTALAAYRPPPADVLARCPSAPTSAIHVATQPDRPQPRLDRDRGAGMTVTVGRVRACPLGDLKLVTLTHNTVLGAAGSSLLNAEIAVVEGVLKARE